jgi:hypothetical protein
LAAIGIGFSRLASAWYDRALVDENSAGAFFSGGKAASYIKLRESILDQLAEMIVADITIFL